MFCGSTACRRASRSRPTRAPVSDLGGGAWTVTVDALASLAARGDVELSATVSVRGTHVDEFDVDGDGSIEDGDNGSGVDERDTLDVTDDFVIVVRAVPTVASQRTADETPTLRGTVLRGAGESLSVTVGGFTYTDAGPELVVDGSGGWTLSLPVGRELPEGTYPVTADARVRGRRQRCGHDGRRAGGRPDAAGLTRGDGDDDAVDLARDLGYGDARRGRRADGSL